MTQKQACHEKNIYVAYLKTHNIRFYFSIRVFVYFLQHKCIYRMFLEGSLVICECVKTL